MKRTGILLVNLGSPSAPNPYAVRQYLKQFLSDRRVVDLPPWQWWPILHGIILNTRPKKVAKAYQSIWKQHSPLIETCQEICTLLQAQSPQPVALAMRYGNPSISTAIASLGDIDQLIVLPLFPQYSSATTAAAFDAVAQHYQTQRNVPALHFIRDYHDQPLYIDALAHSIQNHWQSHGKAEKLLISFHGLPQRYCDEGDCYQTQCARTAQLLTEKLAIAQSEWVLTFQSRFGKEPWLKPYTDTMFANLAHEGIKEIDVISPGFSADCLETLEELAITGQTQFRNAGGKNLRYIAALNSNPTQLKLLQSLINATGWLDVAI